MSKIIIYDNKNILIADLDRTESHTERKYYQAANNIDKAPFEVDYNEQAAIFNEYKIIHSMSLKKQLKKIEEIIKYHKENKKYENNKMR